jgi:hypothetical protein
VSKRNFCETDTKSELGTLIFPDIMFVRTFPFPASGAYILELFRVYFRYLHVSMRSWSSENMATCFHFVDFLRALPNLAGLQIYPGLSMSLVPIISYAFASTSLPIITALAIPDSLDGILRALPNVTVLACPALSVNSKLLAPAKTHCPRLKALAGLRIYKVRDH